MSDAPREEEIYQALAPGGSYKSGLVNPVAAQQETTVSIPMRFKGAMGGSAVGNEEYPDHEPRASVPYKHYKDLEDIDPKLHQAVTHVADEIHIPRTDLASLVYANSDYNPEARNGMRTGYMGLTPDDARQLDPEGHLDINNPIDNLFMGAMKYKRISNRFGMGTPNAFAAYHGGGDRIHALLGQDPDEHRRMAPDGTFDFINKILGRGEGSGGGSPTADDQGAGGDPNSVESMAAAAQAGQQPQRHVPGQGAVPPMVPNQPRGDRDLEPSVGAALAQTRLPTNASPATVWQPPVPGARPPESYEGPPEGAPPRMLLSLDPSATYEGPPEGAPALARTGPLYDPPLQRGIYAEREVPSQATQDVLRDREREDQATPAPPPAPPFYSRGTITPRPPLDPNALSRPMPPPVAPSGSDDTGWQRPMPPPPPDDTGWQRPMPSPPELTGVGGALQPAPVRQEYQPPFTPAPPRSYGGFEVGGAIPDAVAAANPQSVEFPGQPPDQAPPATTGSGAPPRAPAARPTRAIGTDNMAADLNRQELARVQGGRPDVVPTGPTQPPVQQAAPAAAPTQAAPTQAAPTQAAPTPAPTEPGNFTAVGDSLAAHMIRKGGVGGQEDAARIGSHRSGDTAVSGFSPAKVLDVIKQAPDASIKGRDIILSTGASNNPAQLDVIKDQIAELKKKGAKSVTMIGVGNRGDFVGVNDKLAQIAKENNVPFAGALPNIAADKVHSTDPASVFRSAQQALAKFGGGGSTPTTGSATPTTAPGAGGEPVTQLPAGAPRALAPPGSTPTATAAPPIDRLKGNGGAMTPASAVRAGAEGPNGVLTHIARNGPRGMSIGDGWDHYEDLLVRAMTMKGDINGIQHAQEYVFRMKHKGAMENLMQAIGNMDDPNAAAQYLARSHAFVTDGTAVGFQVLNNQIYGQRYDEQTHDKIGKPFQVTEAGLRMQAIANSSPDKFNSNLNTERTTTEHGRHNRVTEKHADEELVVRQKIADQALKEKQIEHQIRAQEHEITNKRLEDAAKQRGQEHAERLAATAQQNELARNARTEAAAQRAADAAEKEAQRRADNAEKAAAREAAETAGHATYAREVTDEYFGRSGATGTVTDPKSPNRIQETDVPKARRLFSGILHHDKTINSPDDALGAVQGHLAGKYKMVESVGDDGKRYAHIKDEDGNVLATVPADIWRMYLPKQGTAPSTGKR